MKLEDQVITLKQARRLEELNFRRPNLFYWINRGKESRLAYVDNVENFEGTNFHPAYTVAELGEMLPKTITVIDSNTADIRFVKLESWFVGYDKQPHGGTILLSEGKTEAQARAAMLIHLLENAILSPAKTTEL